MVKVIIIGSGIAGLVAGVYLAKSNHEVVIYEQNSVIGGVTATLHKEGYSWDLGPMLLENFGPGEPVGEILEELGFSSLLEFRREDRGVVLPDFSLWKPKEYQGPQWRKNRLKELFPEESKGLDHYYRAYYNVMDLLALTRRTASATGLKKIFYKIWQLSLFLQIKPYVNQSAAEFMNIFFKSEKIKSVYTGLLADFVTRPEDFPALGIPVTNNETPFDIRMPLQTRKAGPYPSYRYCIGGMEKLVQVFVDYINAHGGKILPNNLVTKVIVRDNLARGIQLSNGEQHEADYVIMSGGVREAYYQLLGREHLTPELIKKIDDVPFMESVHMVHLGIDFDPLPYQPAALCYYYCTYDVTGAISRCKHGEYHEGKDGFLIYIPSVHSPSMAPPGHHAVTIYTIAPNKLKTGTWESRKEEFTEKLLIEAEKYIPGLRAHTKVKIILTPDDFQKWTHMAHHSFGGRAPVRGKTGGPHHAPIKNVWFIGYQSDKQAGGVPGTITHAKDVIQELLSTIK